MLAGKLFAVSSTGVPQKAIEALVARHGGAVSNVVHRRVDYLVCTEAAIRKNTQAVRKAVDKFSIPLVSPAFLHDSIADGAVKDAAAYAPSVGTSEPNKKKPAAATLEAFGAPSHGRIEVLVELTDFPEQWWPLRVAATSADGRNFDIVYERLPSVGYDEESPSRARFDPAGTSAEGVPDGAMGRLWDGDEQCWRPWRLEGGAAPPRVPSKPEAQAAAEAASSCHGAAEPASQAAAPAAPAAQVAGQKRTTMACDRNLSKAQRKRARRKTLSLGGRSAACRVDEGDVD